MIVIADTSPISYLILIDEAWILPTIYGQIVIPQAVFDELAADKAPAKVRLWFENQPEWLLTKQISGTVESRLLEDLDKGESEAIQLANELNADIIVIDELKGREIAKEYGFTVIGLIGILVKAKEKGLIDAEDVILKLKQTKFFVSKKLLDFLRES